MSDETRQIAENAAADAALALQLVGEFFAGQIDAGAVLRHEIAAVISVAADKVADENPAIGPRAQASAQEMIRRLPAGWADGDTEWREPA